MDEIQKRGNRVPTVNTVVSYVVLPTSYRCLTLHSSGGRPRHRGEAFREEKRQTMPPPCPPRQLKPAEGCDIRQSDPLPWQRDPPGT